jgi:mono/diheme cytochrome c family protein
MKIPRWIFYVAMILTVLSWLPFALIYRERSVGHSYTRLLILPDMTKQAKYRAQRPNPVFADGRADRRPVEGTVALGAAKTDPRFFTGHEANGGWITAIPIELAAGTMQRGRERYDIFCSPCHGLSGDGDGMVAKRADALQEGTWVPPSSLQAEHARMMASGELFNAISNGIRNMPSYGGQIPEADRWAIVAYVRALQLSRSAPMREVPADARAAIR